MKTYQVHIIKTLSEDTNLYFATIQCESEKRAEQIVKKHYPHSVVVMVQETNMKPQYIDQTK